MGNCGAHDRDSQSIGGVVRLGRFLQFEQTDDHFLNLLFVGFSVARGALFYLIRGELYERQVGIGNREQNNATRHADLDRRFGIGLKKEVLYSHGIGRIRAYQEGDFIADALETETEIIVLISLQTPASDIRKPSAVVRNNSPSGAVKARVYPENFHSYTVPPLTPPVVRRGLWST